MKKCTKCGEPKDEKLFSKGMRWCKPCVKIYDRKRLEKYRDKIWKQKQQRRNNICFTESHSR